MRIAVLTGLFACTLILSVGSSTASAQVANSAITIEKSTEAVKEPQSVIELLSVETETALKVLVAQEIVPPAPEPQPVITKHVVTENETLSDIAKKYQTTWNRLYDKNTTLENPDLLTVGLELVVPTVDEVLEPRVLPEPVVPVRTTQPAQTTRTTQSNVAPAPRPAPTAVRGSTSGNGYVAGYCTWYVKNRRPDLPNNLGNAATWVARAAAQGLPTGSTPQVGAVGQRGNHVVYVESVNSDGTVTISEMNYKGLYVQTTRTLPASSFSYIY